jgi:hypothetical protein
MCGVLYVDRVLQEDNNEESEEHFNIPIIYKMKRKRNEKDD